MTTGTGNEFDQYEIQTGTIEAAQDMTGAVLVFGEADEKTMGQMKGMLAAEPGSLGVLCADNHLGYGMPIGGVVAYRNHVTPNGVGFDIGCGNCAVRTDVLARDVDVAKVKDDMDQPPALIRLDTPMGQDYLEAMAIAGEYAYAGRDWVVNRVVQMLGARETFRVHNHHNFAWFEEHFGERWLVTRKGATPAFPGQQGFIGGSMGEDAVIVEGVDSERSAAAMYSTIHGAGRAMGRKKAKGHTKHVRRWKCLNYRNCPFDAAIGDFRRGENNAAPKCPKCGSKMAETRGELKVTPGLIDWTTAAADVRALGIELRGGDADEAPACYKRLPAVLAAHEGTIKVLHQLRVIGVAMASQDVFDPFRD